MNNESPKYDEYSLKSLQEALAWIDRKKYPERVQTIKLEIEKRIQAEQAIVEAQNLENPTLLIQKKASPFRRVIAFLVDMIIISTVWSFLEGFISFPISPLFLNLGNALFFILYFSVFFNPNRGRKSPGKGLLGISIDWEADTQTRTNGIFVRSIFLACLFVVHWSDLFSVIVGSGFPILGGMIVDSVVWALWICNGLLGLLDAWGMTLHDRLAGTRVVREFRVPLVDGADPGGSFQFSNVGSVPLRIPIFALIVSSFLVYGFTAKELKGRGSINPRQDMLLPAHVVQNPGIEIERRIAKELGLRSEVMFMTGWIDIEGKDRQTTFEIEVNLPISSWNDRTVQDVAELVVKDLQVPIYQYDKSSVVLKSSFLFYHPRKIFPLQMNGSWGSDLQAGQQALFGRDYEGALGPFHRVLAAKKQALGSKDIEVSKTLIILGGIYMKLGRMGDAKGCFQESLDIRFDQLGPEHSLVAESIYNLGYFRQLEGNFQLADSLYTCSITMLRDLLGPEAPEMAIQVYQHGRLFQDEGLFQEAETHFRHSVQLLEESPGFDPRLQLMAMIAVAMTADDQGKIGEADVQFEEAFEFAEKQIELESLDCAKIFADWALFNQKRDNCEKATPLFKQAIAIYKKSPYADHPSVAELEDSLEKCESLE